MALNNLTTLPLLDPFVAVAPPPDPKAEDGSSAPPQPRHTLPFPFNLKKALVEDWQVRVEGRGCGRDVFFVFYVCLYVPTPTRHPNFTLTHTHTPPPRP